MRLSPFEMVIIPWRQVEPLISDFPYLNDILLKVRLDFDDFRSFEGFP